MPNALSGETSPYLLQHADNPVEWLPWSEAAFDRARAEDKPVLLSIGYSACHWCHVMAHESFEDAATAALMHRLFVNIKVDREERPDVDRIYQVAHQLLTQRGGGWPLTMFLDPESRRPFFGGTYFPREARYGMPAFGDLMQNVARYFRERREEVREQGQKLVDFMGRLRPAPAAGGVTLDAAPLAAARTALAATFDREYGGFGKAPKFPHPGNINRLLRHWRARAEDSEPDLDALFMATLTLTRMADGGLRDHLGGGFARYSVDRYWEIPHFEKMLYDNAPLLALYAETALATGDGFYAEVAGTTAAWLQDDMQAPNGGFYSTRDADSEGEEGRYYVWTPDEVRALIAEDEYAAFSRRFGLDGPPNFEGRWHLCIRRTIAEIAGELGASEADIAASLDAARGTLLAARRTRVPPARDEKQLCAWNAMAIRGFAVAGRALGEERFVAVASDAADFIERSLFRDGRLNAVYKDGRARFPAYLDDYAFLLDALLELLQARWSGERLRFAIAVADVLLEHFEDRQEGGFWFTADDAEELIHRPKPLADEALPSGNGVAAFALQRLGFLLGETRYLHAAERTLKAAWSSIAEYPHAHVSLIDALEEYLEPPEIIVLRGEPLEIGRWSQGAAEIYAPRRLVIAIPTGETDLPGTLALRAAQPGSTLAYCCRGTHCELPLSSWAALAAQMSGK
jgi:uncharacterized protein YyaL (SSP411 family)